MKTTSEYVEAIARAVLTGGSRRRPADVAEIEALERRLGICLPSDARAFYSMMDGSEMMDAEHGLISLWPLDRWKTVRQEIPRGYPEELANAIVFADHSLWCWAYAARFSAAPQEMTIHIVGGASIAPIAKTFSEFLALIEANDACLYGASG